MKLPTSLLLLIAVGTVTSKLTTDKNPVTSQTTKRELLEGNFGQRTALLTKYEPPNTTPEIQYAENLKQELRQPSALEQIFGSRVFPITKISDLFTGQGPPFEVALANHLYAPVSVYNAKLQKVPALVELSTANPAKIPLSNFNLQRSKSEDDTQYYEDIRPKKTLGREPNFHLPGLLGPEFYTQESKYPQELLRIKPITTTRDPQLYVYKAQPDVSPFIPVNYYQKPSPVKIKPEYLGFDYANQEFSQEDKEQKLYNVKTTSRPEIQNTPSDIQKSYHSHPGGAISFTNFIHNQALLDMQPDSNSPYKVPPNIRQPIFTTQFSQDNHINVLDQVRPKLSDKLAPHGQFPHELLKQNVPFQRGFNVEKLSAQHFFQRPEYPQVYSHPINTAFSEMRSNLNQSMSTRNDIESLGQLPTNNSAIGDASGPLLKPLLKQTRFILQPNAGDSFADIHNYKGTPVTVQPLPVTYQSVATLSTIPAPIQPLLEVSSKSPVTLDQNLQPTTILPSTINDSKPNFKAEPTDLPQESSSFQTSRSVLQSLLVSPVNLQTPSHPTDHFFSSRPATDIRTHIQASPQHQVQIQQQDLQEIHLELAPENRDNSEHLKKISLREESSSETITQYEPTTLKPTEPSKPDYEIEIASNVDHNQLPKDLQPVRQIEETNTPVENLGRLLQQSYSHVQNNQTHVLENRPFTEPIQLFGEPPSYQNINFHGPNSLFLDSRLAPVQPIIQPRVFSNIQDLVSQPHFQQIPSFPPVQYFGKYAESIFGGI